MLGNMKKSIIISAIIVLFILGTVIGVILIKNFAVEKEKTQIAEESQEEIYDDCTDEYEEMVQSNTLVEETSSESEKISPNCSIIFRRYYNQCGHTLEQYSSVPTELVNKTEEDLQKQYEGWTIEEFSKNQKTAAWRLFARSPLLKFQLIVYHAAMNFSTVVPLTSE